MVQELPLASLIVISFLTGVIIAGAVLLKRYNTSQKITDLEQEILRIKRDIRNICSGAVGMGQRIHAIEALLKVLSLRQDQKEMREPDHAQYAHASQLAEMGTPVAEIVKKCGISKAEAELIAVLHRKDNVA